MPFLKKYKLCPRWKEKEIITNKSGSRNTVYFLNGDKHIGEWQNNFKDGKGSELIQSKYLYEGDFSQELRHGHGILSKLKPDGTFTLLYNGEWAHGKRHGYGIQRGENGSWYDGFWREGKRCGEGRMWLCDGSFYHGQWMDDKFHGMGILLLPNRNRYEGEFAYGLKHGEGKFYYVDSKQVQEGVWDEDVCVSSTIVEITTEDSNSPPRFPRIELQDSNSIEAASKRGALEKVQSKISSFSIQAKTGKTSRTDSHSFIRGGNREDTLDSNACIPSQKMACGSTISASKRDDTFEVLSKKSSICFDTHKSPNNSNGRHSSTTIHSGRNGNRC